MSCLGSIHARLNADGAETMNKRWGRESRNVRRRKALEFMALRGVPAPRAARGRPIAGRAPARQGRTLTALQTAAWATTVVSLVRASFSFWSGRRSHATPMQHRCAVMSLQSTECRRRQQPPGLATTQAAARGCNGAGQKLIRRKGGRMAHGLFSRVPARPPNLRQVRRRSRACFSDSGSPSG